MFLCSLLVMYGEIMLQFYKNFKVLENGTVRGVDMLRFWEKL